MKHMFECEAASVAIGKKTLLHPLDLSFGAGELVVVVGPNGAGKSTLMKLLSGDIEPATGSVRYDGLELERWAPADLALRRAVMAQSSRLSFHFTVLEVVRMGARLFAHDTRTANDRALLALERVDLEGYGSRFYQELSGGEQQRVQLARTLCQVWDPVVHDIPRHLFLDEPTASLDIRHQLDILTLAREFVAQGGGCLAILHDLNIAAMFADRIIALCHGRLVAQGTPQEILTDRFMEEVFEVPIRVNQIPPQAQHPFILPQNAQTGS